MTFIAKQIETLKGELSDHVTIVAVTKYSDVEDIRKAYDAGMRDFGENRVQDLEEKRVQLPDDIRWHMIGHVQTNKIKYFTSYIHMVQGVDRRKVLKELNQQAEKDGVRVRCTLQIHIAKEDSKFGLDEDECMALCGEIEPGVFPNVQCVGLMGMATNTDDKSVVSAEFNGLKQLYDKIGATYPHWEWHTLSMGMSGDYLLAVECGSTMVRVGSKIFKQT